MHGIVTSVCNYCGEQFTHSKAKRGPQHRKWCSARCRGRASHNIPQIGTRYVLECVVCMASFTSSHETHKVCSKECRRRHQQNKSVEYRRNHIGACIFCGRSFKGDPDRVFCNGVCKAASVALTVSIERMQAHLVSLERRIVAMEEATTCSRLRCDNRTTGKNARAYCKNCLRRRAIGCCARCGVNLDRRYARVCDECKRQKRRDEKTHSRRARLHGCEVERVVRATVFKRDCWKCQHCGCHCVKASGLNQHNEATLDHIVPISKHGGHTYDNVQLLCRQCNTAKGVAYEGEQLRLIV